MELNQTYLNEGFKIIQNLKKKFQQHLENDEKDKLVI